jgi:hypothetical protein
MGTNKAEKMTTLERLEKLQLRKKQLEARIETLSARSKAESRKRQSRRIFVLGTLISEDLGNPSMVRYLRTRLPKVMTDADLKNGLFDDILKDPTND